MSASVVDPGATLVQPLGITSFTTFIVDPDGAIHRIGRPDRAGYMRTLWSVAETLGIEKPASHPPDAPQAAATGNPGPPRGLPPVGSDTGGTYGPDGPSLPDKVGLGKTSLILILAGFTCLLVMGVVFVFMAIRADSPQRQEGDG